MKVSQITSNLLFLSIPSLSFMIPFFPLPPFHSLPSGLLAGHLGSGVQLHRSGKAACSGQHPHTVRGVLLQNGGRGQPAAMSVQGKSGRQEEDLAKDAGLAELLATRRHLGQ